MRAIQIGLPASVDPTGAGYGVKEIAFGVSDVCRTGVRKPSGVNPLTSTSAHSVRLPSRAA
jgi:hypothetical protein